MCSRQLVTGAWINPYLGVHDAMPTFASDGMTFGCLSSVVRFATLDPHDQYHSSTAYGFTRANVDKFRAKMGPNSKVLLSLGGDAPAAWFWLNFVNNIDETVRKITYLLEYTGADGVDYDWETASQFQQTERGLAEVMNKVKATGKGYIQTLCVMGRGVDGWPDYDYLLNNAGSALDYIIFMGYGQGMFVPGNLSGGKSWRDYTHLWAGKLGSQKHKLVIAMTINNSHFYATPELVDEAATLCRKEGYAGIFFWWYSDDVPRRGDIATLIDRIN